MKSTGSSFEIESIEANMYNWVHINMLSLWRIRNRKVLLLFVRHASKCFHWRKNSLASNFEAFCISRWYRRLRHARARWREFELIWILSHSSCRAKRQLKFCVQSYYIGPVNEQNFRWGFDLTNWTENWFWILRVSCGIYVKYLSHKERLSRKKLENP